MNLQELKEHTWVTLQELKDYAEAHADTEFELGSIDNCMVCKLLESRGLEDPFYVFRGSFSAKLRNANGNMERVKVNTPRPFTDYALKFDKDQVVSGAEIAYQVSAMKEAWDMI